MATISSASFVDIIMQSSNNKLVLSKGPLSRVIERGSLYKVERKCVQSPLVLALGNRKQKACLDGIC